ncbi:hypothetical protein D037_4271 [Vibrio parahaemolyticus IDH02640]|nr:hypothetical protein D037_4271 [Vibrio parahaemolyticus IDH02640]
MDTLLQLSTSISTTITGAISSPRQQGMTAIAITTLLLPVMK